MATYAPSAGNVQDWHFVVVKDEEKKAKLARAALDQDFIKNFQERIRVVKGT